MFSQELREKFPSVNIEAFAQPWMKVGRQTVSAIDLHVFLESKQEFANWIKNRIEQYGFTENTDFIRFDNFIKAEKTNRTLKEYHITLDMAKELYMVKQGKRSKGNLGR